MVTSTSSERAFCHHHSSSRRPDQPLLAREILLVILVAIMLYVGSVGSGALLAALPPEAAQGRSALEILRWRYTTEAYKREALKVLLADVNLIARDLQLEETLPIRAADLIEAQLTSPFLAEHAGIFGSVRTRNYDYFASQEDRLSVIVRHFGEGDAQESAYLESLKRRYAAPRSQINTNAAHALAKRWLAAAGVDIEALQRDSKLTITAQTLGDKFVPVYWVAWSQPAESQSKTTDTYERGLETVACVQLVEPEHTLLQMHVDKAQYIERKPLLVANRDLLLQQTDNPKMRELWFITEAYKRAATQVALKEINRVCTRLGLPEKLPIVSSNLTAAMIDPPIFSDRSGSFGWINTEDYVYAAIAGNKLSLIKMNFTHRNEPKYLSSIKTRYAAPKNQMNTNAAYSLATQWLAAASVDLKALQRDCRVEIEPWESHGQFVPLFQFTWAKGEQEVAARVEVIEPERLLKLLCVEKPEYINRQPLTVPDRESLLSGTNGPGGAAKP